jgi:hypothetical protein
MNKLHLSNKAFWDVDLAKLDPEQSAFFIMQKVFNYGSWNDQIAVLNYYGTARVKQDIVNAPYLRAPVISFLSTILHIPKGNFKCYSAKQLHPLPWLY